VRTSFSELKIGAIVNLERALRADGRLHGHFVTGHIDGIAEVLVFEKRGTDWLLEIAPLEEIKRYLVSKGTIAIDGISLTIAEVLDDRIRIWIIPHTHAVTALRERNVGSQVNIEADLLAKYVAQLIGSR
jgi:riboflavin synthase